MHMCILLFDDTAFYLQPLLVLVLRVLMPNLFTYVESFMLPLLSIIRRFC